MHAFSPEVESYGGCTMLRINVEEESENAVCSVKYGTSDNEYVKETLGMRRRNTRCQEKDGS